MFLDQFFLLYTNSPFLVLYVTINCINWTTRVKMFPPTKASRSVFLMLNLGKMYNKLQMNDDRTEISLYLIKEFLNNCSYLNIKSLLFIILHWLVPTLSTFDLNSKINQIKITLFFIPFSTCTVIYDKNNWRKSNCPHEINDRPVVKQQFRYADSCVHSSRTYAHHQTSVFATF